jgi:hypothetical protein
MRRTDTRYYLADVAGENLASFPGRSSVCRVVRLLLLGRCRRELGAENEYVKKTSPVERGRERSFDVRRKDTRKGSANDEKGPYYRRLETVAIELFATIEELSLSV